MKLYLAEKSSQGNELAQVLAQGLNMSKQKGYIELYNGDIVTWCSGHLLELATPDVYSEKLKTWDVNTLPFFPDNWKWQPIERTRSQLKVIASLLAQADEVVISSDYDREGQLLAINVLNYCNYIGPTYRLKLTATDPISIQRALDKVEPLEYTMGLYYSAVARSHADWLVGINLTRLFTCLARNQIFSEVVNIGRVITPTINLICNREEQIKNFKSRDFYEIEIDVSVQNGSFKAKWVPDDELLDDEGHCFNIEAVQQVLNTIQHQKINILTVERTTSIEQPPLPFSQSKLQIFAARRFGFTAAKTLEICQTTYDKKLTTYPRTDSQYIPESQLDDAPAILAKLAVDPKITPLINGCNVMRKGKAFSDVKMKGHAHNALIPSLGDQDYSSLTQDEFKIYNIIRLYYIAQFYQPAEYNVLTITCQCNGYKFQAKGKTLVKPGYRIIFHEEDFDKNETVNSDNQQQNIDLFPNVNTGEQGFISNAAIQTKQTRAPKHFDEGSLIEAMSNIAKYTDNPEEKKILNDTHGLGTEPTRPAVIENLKKYGWITVTKNHFEATDKAYATMKALPNDIKSPSMTAIWENGLDSIANCNEQDGSIPFEANIKAWIENVFKRCKTAEAQQYIQKILSNCRTSALAFKCQKCGAPLNQLKGQYGKFFICTNPDCKQKYNEKNGKPMPLYDPETAPKCPVCNSALKQFKGKYGNFWKCQNMQCGLTLPDLRGKPSMPKECPHCKGMVFRIKGQYGYYWACKQCKKNYVDLNGKPVFFMPVCPICGGPMRLITKGKDGKAILQPFFSCKAYPSCNGKLDADLKPIKPKPSKNKDY